MAVCGIGGSIGTIGAQGLDHFKKYCHEPKIGDGTSAQSDVVSLSQSFKAQLNGGSPVGQMLSSIGQALQAGDITAAQNTFNAVNKVGPCAAPKGSHVPPVPPKLTQGLTALGEALESGDLSAAQQAYSAVQQVWQQVSQSNPTAGRTLGTSSGVSVHI